jgi:RNA polymerase sigma factor (TIGR02999 family)
MGEMTQILRQIEDGHGQSSEELLALVYDELRRLAASHLAREKPGQTLQPTALVHEAWLRLIVAKGFSEHAWKGRRHFVSAAAEAMRRILIEKARRKNRLRRGGDLQRVAFQETEIAAQLPSEELLALDEALQELVVADPETAELIKLRFYVGLNQQQASQLLGISPRTADRMWSFGRAWLYKALLDDAPGPVARPPEGSPGSSPSARAVHQPKK